MEELHTEVLDKKRRAMLPKLGFLCKDHDFYLAGGTALALQIGHRTSLDFDFYTQNSFSSKKVFQRLRTRFGQTAKPEHAEDTLIVRVQKIDMSFFRYSYRMLRPFVEGEGLQLASKEDIAAMKLIAITQRGTRRDYIDLYYLLKEYSINDIFRWARKKYPEFTPYIGLQALSYFTDADNDQEAGRFSLMKYVSWDYVKRNITELVRSFKKQELG